MVAERGSPTTITEGHFCYRVTKKINPWSHLWQIFRCRMLVNLLMAQNHLEFCWSWRVTHAIWSEFLILIRFCLLLVPSLFSSFGSHATLIGSKDVGLVSEPLAAFISDEGFIWELLWSSFIDVITYTPLAWPHRVAPKVLMTSSCEATISNPTVDALLLLFLYGKMSSLLIENYIIILGDF